jgi:hypothetical protein
MKQKVYICSSKKYQFNIPGPLIKITEFAFGVLFSKKWLNFFETQKMILPIFPEPLLLRQFVSAIVFNLCIKDHHCNLMFPGSNAEILNIVYTACSGISGLVFGHMLDNCVSLNLISLQYYIEISNSTSTLP